MLGVRAHHGLVAKTLHSDSYGPLYSGSEPSHKSSRKFLNKTQSLASASCSLPPDYVTKMLLHVIKWVFQRIYTHAVQSKHKGFRAALIDLSLYPKHTMGQRLLHSCVRHFASMRQRYWCLEFYSSYMSIVDARHWPWYLYHVRIHNEDSPSSKSTKYSHGDRTR